MKRSSTGRYPHQMGVEIIELLGVRMSKIVDIKESCNVWFDELLGQCKMAFSRSELELLPKTPSAKCSRRRQRIEESQDEDVEEPPRKRQSLAKKGRTGRNNSEDIETVTEADDEGEGVDTTLLRSTRRTRAASRADTSVRTTRSTRQRKKPKTGNENKNPGPVKHLAVEILKTTEKHAAETPPITQLPNNDLRNKLNKKSSEPLLVVTPRTPKNVLSNHNSANSRCRPGFLSVKERAVQYEEKILSSGGNTPTPKGPQSNTLSRLGSREIHRTPSGKSITPATPSTIRSTKPSLNSHHTAASSAKRVADVKKDVQPRTPVTRNKNSISGNNRASKRRSLKLSASRSRRSSVLRQNPSLATITQEPDAKMINTPKRDKASKDTHGIGNKTKVPPMGPVAQSSCRTIPLDPKTSRLNIKQTKVLRPKVTRSVAKRAENDQKAEPNLTEVSQSSDVSSSRCSSESRCEMGTRSVSQSSGVDSCRNSSETRHQTVTQDDHVSQSSEITSTRNSSETGRQTVTQDENVHVSHSSDVSSSRNSSVNRRQTVTLTRSSGQLSFQTVETKGDKSLPKDAGEEQIDLNNSGHSASDHGDAVNSSAEIRNDKALASPSRTKCRNSSDISQSQKSSSGKQTTKSGSDNPVRISNSDNEAKISESGNDAEMLEDVEEAVQPDINTQTNAGEYRKKSGSRLSRKSSESRKGSSGQNPVEKAEESENLRPKRTTRCARNSRKASSDKKTDEVTEESENLWPKRTTRCAPDSRKASTDQKTGEVIEESENLRPKRTTRCAPNSRKASSDQKAEEVIEESENLRPKRTTRCAPDSHKTSIDQKTEEVIEESEKVIPKRTTRCAPDSRKASTDEKTPEEVEESENLLPKRTTRNARNKTSSSCSSSDQTSCQRKSSSKSSIIAEDVVEEGENNEVFVIPEVPAESTSRSQRKRVISDSDDGSNKAATKRACVDGKKFESEANSSEDQTESEEDKATTSESDGDADKSLSPKCPANKVVRPHPASFLNNLNKDKASKLFNLQSTGVKSFLRSSPARRPLTVKEQEALRRKELEEKQRKETERLEKRKQQLHAQAEAKKRQREEHWKKVQKMRLQKQKQDKEEKTKLLEKMEHKKKIPEQVLEVKRKEHQERKQLREQKHTEAEERRLQEEAERLRKLKEKEEEDKQHAELLQRKREYEEQERAKRIAEEKQRQEEQRDVERKKKQEELKIIHQQEEQVRLRLQQERDQLRAMKEEQEARRQHEIETDIRRLKELAKQRRIAEIQEQEEKRQQEERYRKLMNGQKTLIDVLASSNPKADAALAHSSMNPPQSPQSYEMTPQRKFKKQTEESIDISELRSDDSTDQEDDPKQKIPSWAQGKALKVALVNQYYRVTDSNRLFGPIRLPDLNEIFEHKKIRFNKRTSSANWDSPLLKPYGGKI